MRLAAGSQGWKTAAEPTAEAEAERLLTLGLVSSSLGHDISNSLALIQFAVDELVEAAAAGQTPAAETVRLLVTGRDRLVAQTHSALRLSGRGGRAPVRHDLGLVIVELVDVMRNAGLLRRVAVEVCIADGDLGVLAHRTELEQLVVGLVVACVDRLRDAPGISRVAVRAARRDDLVCIEVDGGVDAEPSARAPGRHVVMALGGRFEVTGSCVAVELPAVHAATRIEAPESGAVQVAVG